MVLAIFPTFACPGLWLAAVEADALRAVSVVGLAEAAQRVDRPVRR
jgi:hypothetical protein